ncbi:MAG TPA: hypothetical protein VHM90_15345 [Phycisphaerae bacterium]|nr:hypothetical protein [Phycisphaerae bacterium]
MLRRIFAVAGLAMMAAGARGGEAVETEKHTFPTAGISLEIPKGSSLANTLPAGVLFDYWSADKTVGMNVIVLPVTVPGDQYASQMAIQLRGTKEAWEEKIDCVPALRVNAGVKLDKVTSRTSLIVAQEGRVVVVTGFGIDAGKSEETARQLARSVSLSQPEPPAEHVDFSPKVGFAFGEPAARVIVSAPEWLRVGKSAGKQLTLTGYDFSQGKETFIAVMTYVDVPAGMHVAEFAAGMVPQMKARFGVKDREVWASLPENGKIYVTPLLRTADAGGNAPAAYKMGLVEVSPGHILNVTFAINSDKGDEAKAYSELASAMIKNIKLASAAPVAARPAGPVGPPAPPRLLAAPPAATQATAGEK